MDADSGPITRQPTPELLELLPGEIWWRDHFLWLKDRGYLLRRRYEPDWIPSWTGTNKFVLACEDGQFALNTSVLDAKRTSDGTLVYLKCVQELEHPYEAEISEFLASDDLKSDPSNHSVPIYEVLKPPEEPGLVILVMPLLRPFFSPEFDTMGEAVSFIKQIFEASGLNFMHEHNVAHRDLKYDNIMMDASLMYPNYWHPVNIEKSYDYKDKVTQQYTRTQCSSPPKYYLIDYGIARRFDPSDKSPTAMPIMSGDRTAPELQGEGGYEPHNPFPTDVYYIGNLIRIQFLQGDDDTFYPKFGFGWLEPLIRDMTQNDPSKRPTMSEVVARFDELVKSLGSFKLRSMVIPMRQNWLTLPYRWIGHLKRRMSFIIRRTPAIPLPP